MTGMDIFKELSEIDPQFIMDAAPDFSHAKRIKRRRATWATAVAAAILLLMCSPFLWALTLKANNAGPKGDANMEYEPYPFEELFVGETGYYQDGEILFQKIEETSFTFTLTIHKEKTETSNYSYDLQINGWIESLNGTTQLDNNAADALIITVNGERVSEIPCTVGEYNITVDFSKLIEKDGYLHVKNVIMWNVISFHIHYNEPNNLS